MASSTFAADVSAPAMLQMFESSWTNMSKRAPDLFLAGYGGVWIPPAARADSGNWSVGYDVYDRFDLGNADNPTLYGTENTLKRAVGDLHRIGANVYADTILNHNGFNDQSNSGFVASGGYPGFVMSQPGSPYGEFHAPEGLDTSVLNGRLSGLIDIDQSKTFRYVRNPLAHPIDANGNTLTNLPAGTTDYYGKRANVPTDANRRFYQDRNRAPDRMLFNPTTGQMDIPVWDFTTDTAATGDAVAETSTEYLMRNTQWMLQSIGVDGFRLDAAKHFPAWMLNDSFDLAVYRGSLRKNLDGTTKDVFSFSEVHDPDRGFLQTRIRKDINPNDPGRVGGNRDVLDMPLFFAIRDNLGSNGMSNDWRNIVNASQDAQDDGLANNGSQGVAFATSHDDGSVYLSNVAHAYMLMRPGNAIVYFNAHQFGDGRDFPKDGRGDALGGQYGDVVTKLVGLRNTHGRGNYIERWLTKENLVYERDKSAIVGLSNRGDNGYDTLTVQTNFAAGTRLLEMTGNATDGTVDPTNTIADYVVVNNAGQVTINVPRNRNANGAEHDKGYVVYGLPTPRGVLSIPDRATTLAGGTPSASTNGTTRLASIDVVTGNFLTVNLQTTPVVIDGYNDVAAAGDRAIFSINGGFAADGSTPNDLNGNGSVDFSSPANSVAYGFESFTGVNSPLVGGGSGTFRQIIPADKLVEGYNYLEVRAFRARPAGEPAVYSSFKKVVYVDRVAATSSLAEVRDGGGNDRILRLAQADGTADNVHAFLDLGLAMSDAQVLALVNAGGSPSTQIDANLWSRTFGNVGTGTHTLTLVTYEPSGRATVQRQSGLSILTGRGAGLGDVNYDKAYSSADVTSFENYLYGRDQLYNGAADLNADGRIDIRDLIALPTRYRTVGASSGTVAAAGVALVRRGNLNGDAITDAADIDYLYDHVGTPPTDLWLLDLNVDGSVTRSDVDVLVGQLLQTRYGDANLNRQVNFDDLLTLAKHYGKAQSWSGGDFDGSGVVDFADLLTLAKNYNFNGASVTAGGSATADVAAFGESFAADWALAQALVPEPASLSCLLIALPMFRRRR